MTIDYRADRPVYKQLADLIRTQIEQGELIPGQSMPREHNYVKQYGISRDSVRRAMAILRQEGLIVTQRRGSHVRLKSDIVAVRINGGRVSARMPSEPERRVLGLAEGVPILVVQRANKEVEVYPADRTAIEYAPD